MKTSGFTLVEAMITLSLFAIIAAVACAHSTFFKASVARAELHALYATIMHAQRVAAMNNSVQKIYCDVASNSYTYNGRIQQLPQHLEFGYLPAAQGPPSAPKKLITSGITFENQCITIAPHGIIQAGTVYLVDTHKTSMYALTVPIADYSYIRKYRYDGAWHHMR